MIRNTIIFLICITCVVLTIPCFGNDSTLTLSVEEKAWIDKNHTVRVRIGNAPPFMLTSGKIQGIAIDYLTHIFDRNGIKFAYVRGSEVTWPQALNYIKQHQVVDMVPTAKITEDRKKQMIFTDEYLFAPWVIFTRSDANFLSSIEDLKGKTVSVEEGFVIHEKLKRDYPEINLKVALASSENYAEIPLKDLSTGLVDAYIGNLFMTTYMMQAKGYTNIKVAAPTPFDDHNQAMAIRSDWPELVGIINKTLLSMTPEEHAVIRHRWLAVRYEYGISKFDILKWSIAVGIFVLIIIAVVLVWNRKLKNEVIKRRKSEFSLKQSEEKYRAAFHSTPNAITLTNVEDGTYMDVNDGFTKMLGYSQKEVVKKSSIALNIWNDSKDREYLVSGLKQHGVVENLEAEFIGKYGQIRTGRMSARLLDIKDKKILLAVTQDVTKMKQAEAALKKSEERYRLIAENAADVIWTMDMSLNFTFISPSIYQQRGYSVEEVMTHSLAEVILPDSLEKVMDLFARAIARIESGDKQGFSPVEFEVQQPCKDDSVIWTSNNARILPGPDNQPASILGMTHDITARKRAEEEKIKAQLIAEEQKKLALVGQIAGKMAHDFNNVLGVIMGNTELALIDCNDEQAVKTLKLIFEQTVRGKNLTKNLVAFAKDQEPKQEYFRINEKIDLVLNLLKRELGNIVVIKTEEPVVPDLLADPGMIEHAFVNLIQNSIHAMSMTQFPQINIKTYCSDEIICIEIKDNGCGIPKESLERIYEPAFTLKGNQDLIGSYKMGIRGTGYGMANVKKYIEQHKGTIFVRSKIGSGTLFTIRLPVFKKELTHEEKTIIQNQITQYEKYILLVEDEMAISDVQYRVLTQAPCSHKVDIANNGQVAMDLFDRNPYDFVSLDYILPGGISGMDVYNHIRETDKTIPILFISGNIEFLESIKELKQKDTNIDHLSKPCRNKDYINSINGLLEAGLVT